MSTITVCLGELKEHVDAAAAKARKSSHDYIIDAISEAIGREEMRAEFVGSALARRERFQQTDRSVSFEDMETYALDSAQSARSLESKPITYLVSHAAEVIDRFDSNAGPLVITQNGEEKLVVMSVQQYEQDRQSMALLHLLARGRQELSSGRFTGADAFFREEQRQPLATESAPVMGSEILAGMPFNDDPTLGEIAVAPLPNPNLPASLVLPDDASKSKE